MRRVRVLDEAAEEASEAAAWYEREHPGLGVELADAVDDALDLLEEEIVPLVKMPGAAGRKGIKRLFLRRFPYDIVVYPRRGEIIVVAIAHQSRCPGYWKGRVRT